MNFTNNRNIQFHSGLLIPAGTNCDILFKKQDTVCEIVTPDRTVKLRCSSLPRYFSRFKEPSLKTMEKWNDTGIAKSMLGHKVEPDGYDYEGSPSWMLVMGIM